MPRGRRLERLTSRLKEDLSEIIAYQLKDPRIGFTTVMRVKLAADLTSAVAYVTVMGDEADERDALRALESARGFIQTEIARTLDVRRHPELRFEIDEGIKASREVSKILRELEQEQEPGSGLGEAGAGEDEPPETQTKEEES